MISDDKRREVAKGLRNLDDETIALIDERIYRLTDEELAGCAVLGIGLCKAVCEAGLDTKTMGDFWDLLADLIDPTCRNVSGYKDAFECSECRCKVELITEVCNEYGEPFHVPLMPSYCPNCGARVVRGDEG